MYLCICVYFILYALLHVSHPIICLFVILMLCNENEALYCCIYYNIYIIKPRHLVQHYFDQPTYKSGTINCLISHNDEKQCPIFQNYSA